MISITLSHAMIIRQPPVAITLVSGPALYGSAHHPSTRIRSRQQATAWVHCVAPDVAGGRAAHARQLGGVDKHASAAMLIPGDGAPR